jgi:hypothetical protein
MQLLSVISTIDELNYPEKIDTYYVVNAPMYFQHVGRFVSIFMFRKVCLLLVQQNA